MSHGKKERTEDYKTKQWKARRHRRCTEQQSLFANSISNLYTKRLPQNSYQGSVRYTSVALCAVGTSVTLRFLRPLRDSVCLICKSYSLSLHISEEPLFLLFELYFCNNIVFHSLQLQSTTCFWLLFFSHRAALWYRLFFTIWRSHKTPTNI